MSPFMLSALLEATWQTIYMVFVSSFFSILLGLAVGVILFATRSGELLENKPINAVLGVIVNITRSVPYIIFMIAIIPLTRVIVGTSIGINAAIVPLTLAAIPFYARIAESAISEVSRGLVEAAQSLGASPWQIIVKVWIPEALPALINGGTLTIISLIGYSAMAGAVGGGGLGELAIQFGYQRFDVLVMLETVIVLVVMVQIIQSLGDWFAKRRTVKWVGIISIVLWIASLGFIVQQNLPQAQSLKVGVVGAPMAEVMKVVTKIAKKDYGLKIKTIVFQDYVLPNTALNNGNIDANIFQHVPYLDAQIKSRHYKLTPIAKTFVYPMGLFSKRITKLSQLTYGALVAIPNDPSNEGRALDLLQKAGLIKLRKGAGLYATPKGIVSNTKGLQFKSLDAAQMPRVLKDVSVAAITNDYQAASGFTLKQALYHEGPDNPYANVIVVRTQDKNKPIFKKLIAAVQNPAVVKITEKLFNHSAVVAWKQK